MKCVVFLPGIMGSELRHSGSNKRVWPPSIGAIIAKSVKAEALLDENLIATKPIERVTPFYSVYRSLLNDIEACGYSVGGNSRRFIPFAYDWRKSNQESAKALSDHLNEQEDFVEIVLIGHSMGGLILRYLLESGEFNDEPWFAKVTQLITLGTPHQGAALALKQVAGLASNLGMSAENVKTLVSDERYPSAYQLVAPSGNAMMLKAASSNQIPEVMRPFDDGIVARYELQLGNVEASQAFWSKLDVSKRPSYVRYFSFVGSAHKTLTRMEWTGADLVDVESNDSGDGTVPVSSSLNSLVPHSFSQKKHANIFADRKLRAELFRMLGAPVDVRPQSVSQTKLDREMTAGEMMGISTDREDYSPVDTMEVVVSFVEPQSDPRCRFQIVSIDPDSEGGDVIDQVGKPITVKFRGVALENFKFNMSIDLVPGIYELQVANQVDDPERTFFIVAE